MTVMKWEYIRAEVIGPDGYRVYEWNQSQKKSVGPITAFAGSNAEAGGHSVEAGRQIEMLNRLGAEGWEVVQTLPAAPSGPFLLKRLARS